MLKLEVPSYNNAWFDNGVVTLYELLKLMESKGDVRVNSELSSGKLSITVPNVGKFGKELSAEIRDNKKSIIVNQEEENISKEIKKDFILLQEGKKKGGEVKIKEVVLGDENEGFIVESLKSLSEEGRKRNCVVCGRRYDPGDIRSKLKLKQAVYPLSTKIKSLSGIRTYKNEEYLKFSKAYHDNICPLCYLIGAIGWENEDLIYRTFISDRLAYVFLPVIRDLERLQKFRKSYTKLLNNEERWSNIKVNLDTSETENTAGKFSTLLCFYEKFLDNIDFGDICLEWNVLRIPLGNVKNVKNISVNTNEDILGILKEIIEEGVYVYVDFLKRINFFKRTPQGTNPDWDVTNEVREKLAKAFLEDDFNSFTVCMLPRKGGYVGFSKEVREVLEEILYHWRWKKMSIQKEDVGSIRKVGNIVAKTCQNNPSLLYKLDKAKNKEELWDSLRQVSRKLAGMKSKNIKGKLSPTALDSLVKLVKGNEEDWNEVKNLLVIYSSMSYSIEKLQNSRGDNNESE